VEEYRGSFTGSASHTPTSRYGVHSDMEVDALHGPPSSGGRLIAVSDDIC
jgi:hypothetical protein